MGDVLKNYTIEIQTKVKLALLNRENVYIDYNNETGSYVYSIGLESEPGFWLNAFKSKEAAEGFCRKHGLTIKNYYNNSFL